MNKKKFNQLKAKWYQKLKASGFKDIELSEDRLHEYDSLRFQSKYTPEQFADKERYWQLVNQTYYSYPFIDNEEKEIWRLYAEGNTFQSIADKMDKNLSAVYRIIKRVSKSIK